MPHDHPQPPSHARDSGGVLAAFDTTPLGLSDDEAARRLARVGPNRLTLKKPASAWAILLDQLASVIVVLLVAAAGIALVQGDLLDAAAIGAVLVINTTLGLVIDLRARRAMEALLAVDVARSAVVRGGTVRTVDAGDLVPGDVIDIDRGQHVPADARLIVAHELRADEASLTGESRPVAKDARVVLDEATPLADRVNMVYKGTTIAAGTGRAVIVATGVATELGRVGELVAMIREERTPLERRLDQLGRRLVWLVIAVAAAVAALGVLRGEPAARVIQTAIALAVAAVPEALPAVATIALAVGLRRMAARHALVRRLAAVEALGSTTVICSDKTKTLTEGRMTLVEIWTPAGSLRLPEPGGAPIPAGPDDLEALRVAVCASRARAAMEPGRLGPADDPVDAAILAAGDRLGLDVTALTSSTAVAGRLPFSSERQLMATFVDVDGELTAFVKGAPGRVLALCDRAGTGAALQTMDAARREGFHAVNRRLGTNGLRVLGIATGPVTEAAEAGLKALRFVGFAGIMDPPAPGVKEAIARLRQAGLRTIMLTGDQRTTAEAVGRELGLISAGAVVLDGRDLAGMSPDALRAAVADVTAFSRIAPEHKLSVVRALQDRGEIVAMLGDGVNDAPALKQADVGVAMGVRGTDVAKDAASMVLQDDRFDTILAAVEEGRTVYDNIRKFVFYLFSCNLAEVLVLLVAAVVGWPAPLLPLQILWLNMVTDTFPALALAMEPGDPDVMRRPPRDPREAILSAGFVRSIATYAALITASALGAFAWALSVDPARAPTVCFLTLGFAQVFHLGNARSPQPVLRPARIFANPYAIGAVLLTIGLQVAAVQVPALAQALQTTALEWSDWGVVMGLALVPACAGQLLKLWRPPETLTGAD